jgi:F-type H+-transporting ATPase subunit alpha
MQLERGVRLVELLKQPQFQPMSLAEEVLIIFAGTRGYLDKYAVAKVRDYEVQVIAFAKNKYPQVMDEIDNKMIISPDLEKKLKDMLTEFDSVFVAG